jgi:hypothetical protein
MNDATIVYRQIHPTFVQGGFPTSQAFRPTPKDESKLSVYDGDQITAENAFKHYFNQLKLASLGVMGLTVSECAAESLAVCSDPDPFPEHATIDFSGLTDKECRNKSKKLHSKAVLRGWLHRAS